MKTTELEAKKSPGQVRWGNITLGLILLVIILLVTIGQVIGATITSTTTGGNWNSNSTWVGGTRPANGDNVVIATTSAGGVIVDGVRTCVNLTINSRGILTINGTNTLNVNGTISMPRPATNYVSALNVNAGTLNVTGLFTMSASTGTRYNTLTISTGTANLGALTTSGVASRIAFTGAGRLNLSGTPTGTTHTLTDTQGTVNFTGNGAQNVWPKTYYNLGISGSGTKTLTNTTTVNNVATIDGTLTLSSRQLVLNGIGTPLVINGTLTPATGTVNYAGSGAQNITEATYYLLSTSGTGTKTFIADATTAVTRDMDINASTVVAANATVNVARHMTGAGALSMVSGLLTIGGTNSRTGTFTPGAGTVEYRGNAAQAVRVVPYYNLKLSANGSKSIANGSALVINNDLDVGSQLTLPGTASADVTGNILGTGNIILQQGVISLEGDWLNEGNLESGTSTVVYDGPGDQMVGSNVYYNLETSEDGSKILLGNVTINRQMTVGTGTDVNLGTNTLNLTAAGTPLVNNGVVTTAQSKVNYTNTGQTQIAPLDYNDLDCSGGPRVLPAEGSVGIAGTFLPGAGVYQITDSTVNFNGTGDQVIPGFIFNEVILSGAGQRLIQSPVSAKRITIQNGPVLNLDNDAGGELTITD